MPMWYVSVIACLRLDNFSFFSFCCTDQTKKYVHKCGQRWRWKKTLTCDICHMLFCRAFSVRPTHICGIFMRPITILLPFFLSLPCHEMGNTREECDKMKWKMLVVETHERRWMRKKEMERMLQYKFDRQTTVVRRKTISTKFIFHLAERPGHLFSPLCIIFYVIKRAQNKWAN